MSPLAIASRQHPRRRRFRLRGALARFRVAIGRLLAPLCFEHRRGLLAFGAGDFGLALAFGLEHHGALLALRLHLPRHRIDEVFGRLDVLDLDARDFDAPGLARRHRLR